MRSSEDCVFRTDSALLLWRSQRLKGGLMRLTTPEGDMWRVDVAMTACGSVLEARIVPPGCVGPTRKCGAIFLELYLLGALESVLKLSP